MASMSPLQIDGRWHPEMTHTTAYICVRYLPFEGQVYRYTEENMMKQVPGSRATPFYNQCQERCNTLNKLLEATEQLDAARKRFDVDLSLLDDAK